MSDENIEHAEKKNLSDKLWEILEDELSNLSLGLVAVSDDDEVFEISCCEGDDEDNEDNVKGNASLPHDKSDETILKETNSNPVEKDCKSEKTSTASIDNGKQNDECHDFSSKLSKGVNTEEFFRPIPDHQAERILRQVEDYFKDYNIFKNSFLLDHVMRNKEGYVSLKLVTSFRKIKAMARDTREVAYSLSNSKILEFNAEKNKIRRIEPIPKIESTSFGKTVMVFNLPQQNLTREYLRDLFSKFGKVVHANVYEDCVDTNPYHKRCLRFHREIASKIYGIVEFERYEQLVNALKDDEGHLPKENEMKVVPLMPQIYKKQKKNLRFLKQYSQYPRRGYGRYKPRDDSFPKPEVSMANGDFNRNPKMNNGAYGYKRGYYRRPYRGRKPFVQSGAQDFSDHQISQKYPNKRWPESRQLKANNSINIDRLYSNNYRKKHGEYVEAGV